jgi:ABC-type sugar transport system ATPase subunit
MREAWRHERHDLESELVQMHKQWAIVFIFVGQELADAQRCRKAIQKLVKQAEQRLGTPED